MKMGDGDESRRRTRRAWIGGIREGRPEFIVVGIYLQPVGMNIQPGFILRVRRFLARHARTPRLAGAGSRVNETRWKKKGMQISRKCRGLVAYVRRRPIKIPRPAQIRGFGTARQIRPRGPVMTADTYICRSVSLRRLQRT